MEAEGTTERRTNRERKEAWQGGRRERNENEEGREGGRRGREREEERGDEKRTYPLEFLQFVLNLQ